MQGNITIYTSNESFEESQKLRISLREIGFAYQEQDISSQPGKSFNLCTVSRPEKETRSHFIPIYNLVFQSVLLA
jgi:hypothetical protein